MKEMPPSFTVLPLELLQSYENLVKLPYLYDESVLDCIIARYEKKLIYTWAGPILVAVNPIKSLRPYYSSKRISTVHQVLKCGQDYHEPHVFTVAGLAHCRLTCEIGQINQAILVSGESGAGKTESAKYLLSYLTHVDVENDCGRKDVLSTKLLTNDIQSKILASNPILEAFGNAATLRNHNSSRFGKFIRLLYNGGRLQGAEIETYLLEKTRITKQPRNERNFHIFYQLLSGVSNGIVRPDVELDGSDSFLITPGYGRRNSEDDLLRFKETVNAFNGIGISPIIQRHIFNVVTAIMCLGNIMFQPSSDGESYTVSSDEVSVKFLSKASYLLSLPTQFMEEVFTRRKIAVTTGGKTTIFTKGCERIDQCESRRDSLMQLLYLRIFSYVVAAFNSKSGVYSSRCSAYLGILDIYGFEVFEQNSLEQLCINYTNERLQQEFTRRYIATENQVLLDEGFVDFPFTFTDNLACLSALDSKISVFAILNEECQLRRAVNESEACLRICSALATTGVVSKLSHLQSGFLVKHYAGNVSYRSSGLLHKNKEEISEDILELLSSSENDFVSNLVPGGQEQGLMNKSSHKGLRKTTTLSKFKASLDSLIKILSGCDLHYVRCLKPNLACDSENPDKSFLLEQLRTNGVLETVKISQAGFPVRMLYVDFVKRYKFNRSSVNASPRDLTAVIIRDIIKYDTGRSIPEDMCRFGSTRVFISESTLHKMEESRAFYRNRAAISIQKNIKRYIAQKIYLRTVLQVIKLQSRIKTWLCQRQFLKKRSSIVTIQNFARCYFYRKKYLKLLHSTLLIQKCVRGWICRRKYADLLFHLRRSEKIDDRPPSRVSLTSSGYGSLAPTSYTDFSVSDQETNVPRNRESLIETEESGIETDTESLSGEGHKAGRSSRLKSRNSFSLFRPEVKFSDDDVSDVGGFVEDNKKKLMFIKSRLSSSLLAPINPEKPNKMKETNVNIRISFNLNPRDDIGRIIESIKMDPLKVVYFTVGGMSLRFYHKNGVISRRFLTKGKIRFHTRLTCLPFSTSIPFYEKPKGLIDAF